MWLLRWPSPGGTWWKRLSWNLGRLIWRAPGRLIARGAQRIVIIPYFLTLGTHMQRDLPRLARDASHAHGDIEMRITSPLDGHPALVQALLDRATEALGTS